MALALTVTPLLIIRHESVPPASTWMPYISFTVPSTVSVPVPVIVRLAPDTIIAQTLQSPVTSIVNPLPMVPAEITAFGLE